MPEFRETISFTELGIPYFVTLTHVRYNQSHLPLSTHTHPGCYEICYHCSGTQNYTLYPPHSSQSGISYRVKGGDLFLVRPNTLHGSGGRCEEKSDFYYIIFSLPQCDFLNMGDSAALYLKQQLNQLSSGVYLACPSIKDLLANIFLEYQRSTPLTASLIQGYLLEFLHSVLYSRRTCSPSHDSDIQYLQSLIRQNPTNTYTVAQLAAMVHLSESRLKQKFKDETGLSPMHFISSVKIDAVKTLLQGNRTITEIAFALGYSSSQHFATAFKKATLQSPREYRKNNR